MLMPGGRGGLSSPTDVQYVPPLARGEPDHLLVVRDGTLIAQPVDPNTYVLAGEALPLRTSSSSRDNIGMFSVSSSGALAFRSIGSVAAGTLTWMDRAGKSLGTLGQRSSWPYR